MQLTRLQEIQNDPTYYLSQKRDVRGTYKDNRHQVVMVTILRSEIHALQHLVRDIDDRAFVTILTRQTVYGDGFKAIHPQMPLRLDEVDA